MGTKKQKARSGEKVEEKTHKARSGENVVRHSYYIQPDQVRWLRVTAAKENLDASRLLRLAIDYFKRTRPDKLKR